MTNNCGHPLLCPLDIKVFMLMELKIILRIYSDNFRLSQLNLMSLQL